MVDKLSFFDKYRILLSGTFILVFITYLALFWVTLDGYVEITSKGVVYKILTPLYLSLGYFVFAIAFLLIFLHFFSVLKDVSLKDYFTVVLFMPKSMISDTYEGRGLYLATSFLFVGLILLALTPLLVTPPFPDYTQPSVLIFGALFSLVAVYRLHRLVEYVKHKT